MKNTLQIEVIASPSLSEYYRQSGSTVVMVDAIRASATIATALHYGAQYIVPLTDIEEARSYSEKGYLIAAERNTEKVDGFDKGNSPYEFMDPALNNRPIAMTTTNGTRAIRAAKDYNELLIGGFVNFNALSWYLLKQQNHITVLCSGWKMRINIEDNLFAGKLTDFLMHQGNYTPASEGATIARTLYLHTKSNLYANVINHSPRLATKEHLLTRDIDYCLQEQNINVIPHYHNGIIKAHKG